MNTDDSVDEYRACSCTGGGCPCVPTACGDLSNNCVRGFEADQVHNFMFTAVNCGNQQSTASTLTVDARGNTLCRILPVYFIHCIMASVCNKYCIRSIRRRSRLVAALELSPHLRMC